MVVQARRQVVHEWRVVAKHPVERPRCASDRAGHDQHQHADDEHRNPPAVVVTAGQEREEHEPRRDAEPAERVEPEGVAASPKGVQEYTDDDDQGAPDQGCRRAVIAAWRLVHCGQDLRADED